MESPTQESDGSDDLQSGTFGGPHTHGDKAQSLALPVSAERRGDPLLSTATAFHRAGRFDEAVASYRQAIEAGADSALAHNNLGVALRSQGNSEQAIDCYNRAIALKLDYADAHYNLGNALRSLGMWEKAIASYGRALRIKPSYKTACTNLGLTFMDSGRFEEAAEAFGCALNLAPDDPEARLNLGVALWEQGKFSAAEANYRAAVALSGGEARAHHNLANALNRRNRLNEALDEVERAVHLDPAFVPALSLSGQVLVGLGRYDEALEAFDRALTLDPDNLDAHLGKARACLLSGEFLQGWEEFEWRWRRTEIVRRDFPQPEWDGSPLEGRTLLLHAEQGLGDSIQFVRYAQLVEKRGGRIVLECQPPLARLFGSISAIDEVVPAGRPLPGFDVHAPLLSLPRLSGTTLETIPAGVPYIRADDHNELVRSARAEASDLEVGIVWKGSPRHNNDANRSCTLDPFIGLAAIPGLSLCSLQKGSAEEEIDRRACRAMVRPMGDRLEDFADTAAMVRRLDLVICVDTAVAHLAGAMAKPVWTLLPYAPDWRWLRDGKDTPWYPTMRLYRQRVPGDWDDVFVRVARDLEKLVHRNRSR